jgi:hypothetical protein
LVKDEGEERRGNRRAVREKMEESRVKRGGEGQKGAERRGKIEEGRGEDGEGKERRGKREEREERGE